MNIAIVGTGYVGLVSGACFSELGNNVWCIDIDSSKVLSLKDGNLHIYEPGLESLVKRNMESGRLHFQSDLSSIIDSVDIVFSAVGTPSKDSGEADISAVLDVAKNVGSLINRHILFVNKSTVPVGTTYLVKEVIRQELLKRDLQIEFDVASNPEFLKEGNAVDDFMKPDRVIVGVDSENAKELMTRLYKPMLLNNFRVLFMDIPSAEMAKYASNAMLATRISFMNDIANLCELLGADIDMVRIGIGSDSRIGNKFLYAGCGYGGSCFPKDIRALISTARQNNCKMRVIEAVEEVNNLQKSLLFNKFIKYFDGDIKGRSVAIWGLSFKPGTDDMREAPSLTLIKSLLNAGCHVKVYDPVAMREALKYIGDSVYYAKEIYDAVSGTDAIFHITEWKEFRMPDWNRIKGLMRTKLIIDGRNVFDKNNLEGFDYIRVG